jgi:hypothetical protein
LRDGGIEIPGISERERPAGGTTPAQRQLSVRSSQFERGGIRFALSQISESRPGAPMLTG